MRSRALNLASLLAAAALAACGPAGATGGHHIDAHGTGGDDDGGNNGSDADANSTPGIDAPACASSPHKAQTAPLDMYIMLDQSGSMQGTKWDSVTQALKTFVQQPNLDGFSVGLQYFGIASTAQCPTSCTQDVDCGTGNLCLNKVCFCVNNLGDSCAASDYAHPEVEIAPLPGNSTALVNSINAHSASTGTPTSAALQGAVDHAKAWANAHPSDVTVVVLATDGEPEECDTNLTNIDNIAKTAYTGNPKVPTFVIGVGTSLSNLNGIAAAGGTGQAFIVDTTGNVGQQFLDALNQIRGNALGCRYSIPLPDTGNPDYANVTVTYKPSSGGSQAIPHVANMGACGTGPGWYYDDNAHPTQIMFCDKTCTAVSADTTGEVDIFTPCTVIVN